MNTLHQQIVDTVKKEGIFKTHVSDILNEKQLQYFYQTQELYEDILARDYVKERFRRINIGNPIKDRSKWYEVTQYELLKRGLNTDDSLVKLYLQQPFIDIAKLFYGELPKVRNILLWAHPKNGIQKTMASQYWHRDQEDYKTFKVFINFSNITLNNGALQYCKKTQHGGEYGDILPNMTTPPGRGTGGPNAKFKYPIPKEEVVSAVGEPGTVHFINTNGIHRGGLVQDGIRLMTQCNYLKADAPIITKLKTLATFNHNPKVNTIDYNSKSFNSLSTDQKYLLQ